MAPAFSTRFILCSILSCSVTNWRNFSKFYSWRNIEVLKMPWTWEFRAFTRANSISGSDMKYDWTHPTCREDIWLSLAAIMLTGAVCRTLKIGTMLEKMAICASWTVRLSLKSTGVRGTSSIIMLTRGESFTRSLCSLAAVICLSSACVYCFSLARVGLFLETELIRWHSWSISLIASSVRFSSPEFDFSLVLMATDGTYLPCFSNLVMLKGVAID